MTDPRDTPTTDALVDEALAQGEGLGRPLRYVQINAVPSGSTGAVMMGLHRALLFQGAESHVCWGRGRAAQDGNELNFGTPLGVRLDALATRLDDRAGFHSRVATRRLLERLDGIDPDVVHLHNLHGYYANIEMLFGWLAGHRCQVRWTLHDCWAFTGHCAHFQYVGCDQWKTGCHDCPQKKAYPASYVLDSSRRNWEDKRRIFTSVPADRMTLITPSHWLEGLVRQSFLKSYPVGVRHNTVDTTVFKPTPSDFRERYGVGDRFMVLGVASPWTERKGLGDFFKLAGELGEGYAVVLVGLDGRQQKAFSKLESRARLIGLGRTESREELAAVYTAADVLLNPTREDNYPTVNLEAQACGTPVVTYDVGGCAETLSLPGSSAIEDLPSAIERICDMQKRKPRGGGSE